MRGKTSRPWTSFEAVVGTRGIEATRPGRRRRWRHLGAAALTAMLGTAPLLGAVPAAAETAVERTLRAVDEEKFAFAARLADTAGGRPLTLYVLWRQLLEGTPPPTFETVARFMTENPDWPGMTALQRRAEDALGDGTSVSARLAFFKDRAPLTRQGRLRYVEALFAAGRSAEAVRWLRRAWIADDFGQAEEAGFLDRYRGALRQEDHRARLDRLLWDGEITEAQRLTPFLDATSRLVATARIKFQGLERDAETGYAAVPRFARSDPGLQYDRVRFFARRSRDSQALTLLLHPPATLGRPDLWWEEQRRVLRQLMDDRRFEDAYALARAHGHTAGTSFADGEFLAGWLALRRLDQPRAARTHFARLWEGVRTPISRARAAYWAGRAASRLGDKATAAAWYRRASALPATFYGQEAARELAQVPAAAIGRAPKASPGALRSLRARTVARAARLLCAADDPGTAQPFFRYLGGSAGNADSLRAVVELARTCAHPELGLTAARAAAAATGEIDPHAAFPLPHEPAFRAGGDGLPPPALRLAVARQESLFNPQAQSPAGALGLMQLLPGTARATARRAGLPYAKSRLLNDTGYNVRLGSLYLGAQLKRYDDEAALALAAYNAGPGRVDHWLDELGDPRGSGRQALLDWIEMVPFGETRNYVQRVLEASTVYARLLDQQGARKDRRKVPPAVTAADGS